MKKISLLLLFLFFSFKSYANILISKTYIQLDEKNRNELVKVTNVSKNEMEYKVKFLHFKQLENGRYETIKEVKESDMIADKFIYISPKKFSLKPGETQTIRIYRKNFKRIDIADLPEGEYRTQILFTEVKKVNQVKSEETEVKNLSFRAEGLVGVSIPLVVRKGKLHANASIVEAKVVESEDKKALMYVKIKRDGNKSTRGDIIIKNSKGVEMGLAKVFSIYTSTDARFIEIPLYKDTESYEPLNIKDITGDLTIEYINVFDDKNIFSSYKLNYENK